MATNKTSMMLGNLSIGVWTASVANKDAARKTEKENGAAEGTVSTRVKLMDGVGKLEAIGKYATTCRNEWAKMAAPWFDSGPRVFNVVDYFSVLQQVGDWETTFKGLVDDFVPDYPAIYEERKFVLGTLFDPKKFPHPDKIRDKFYFSFETSTMPDKEDIRYLNAGFSPEQVEEMIAAAAEKDNEKVRAAMVYAADKLLQVVQAMHSKLDVPIGETGHIFRDSLIENIAEVVELMPRLNITNDPELKNMAAEAKKLALYSPGVLREDATARATAAANAKTLASKLAGMFGSA